MKKIRKAIIPAAGLGTRMLPISYAVPKEMLPIVDLPAVYHLVKEAVDSGIEDILIITNRGKEAMESFFDRSTEYETALSAKGKTEEIKMLREISDMANVYFLRQKETRGLGHAVGRARNAQTNGATCTVARHTDNSDIVCKIFTTKFFGYFFSIISKKNEKSPFLFF